MGEKRKIDNTHEKIAVLKGPTVVNFLHRNFQLLWMVKTLLIERPSFTRITDFRLEYHKLVNYPKTNIEV